MKGYNSENMREWTKEEEDIDPRRSASIPMNNEGNY